ncbi:MAG: hypothetical protein R3F34_20935 [Planctomycetota bacterium]
MHPFTAVFGAALGVVFAAPRLTAQQSAFTTPGMPTSRSSGQTDRFSNEFNPAIGAVIDAVADWRDPDGGEDGFDATLRALEIGINGRVDPDWWAYAVVVAEEDEIGVEEAAAHYLGIGGNTTLRFGKFFADFGKQMQVHIHDLPYLDRPDVLAEYLGEELPGVGAQIDHWWATGDASALRVSFGVFADLGGEHEDEGGSPVETVLADRRGLGDLAFTGRVTQFFDVGENGVLQWGLSARHLGDFSFEDEEDGLEATGLSNTVYGADLTYGWTDASGLSGWTFGGEFLVDDGDLSAEPNGGLTALDVFDDSVSGWYAWGERRFDAYNSVGAVLGGFEHPEPGTPRDFRVTGFYTRNLSEFARLRLSVGQLDSDEGGDETQVALQLTTFFGPHSHGVNW